MAIQVPPMAGDPKKKYLDGKAESIAPGYASATAPTPISAPPVQPSGDGKMGSREQYIQSKAGGASLFNPQAVSPTPYSSEAGSNVANYINSKSATLGQDPGAISEAGKLYADRVTNGLKTPDASSVNAQNTEDTAASRRQYMANLNAGERLGQSGFAAGSAQATRIADQSQAGVNAANQEGQSSVNAYVRQRTEDNMSRAQALENQQYGRNRDILGDAQALDTQGYNRDVAAKNTEYAHGRDAMGDARYADETTYSRGQTAQDRAERAAQVVKNDAQQAFENKVVLDGKDDAAKTKLLNSLPDGPAKNAVTAGLADGSLTIATALAKVMNPDGTIKEEFRGKTPGALGFEAEKEYASQTVSLENPGLDLNSPEGIKLVQAKILANRKAKENPITQGAKAENAGEIKDKLNTGGTLTDEENKAAIKSGVIPPLSLTTIPKGSGAVNAFLQQNPSGKFAVNGEVYTLVSGSSPRTGRSEYTNSPRHTDIAEIKDSKGVTKYYYDGAIHDSPPGSVGKVAITPFGF